MVDLPAFSVRRRISISVPFNPRPAAVFPKKASIHTSNDRALLPNRLNRPRIERRSHPLQTFTPHIRQHRGSPFANMFVIANTHSFGKSFIYEYSRTCYAAPVTSLYPGGGMATVGERIKEVREARNWTQEKLSDVSGISKSFLSEVENKGKNI